MLTAIRKNGLTLAVFACAATGLVALTSYFTHDEIEKQEQIQLLSILNQVIPTDAHDNELYKSCTLVHLPNKSSDSAMPAYLATNHGVPSGIAIEAITHDGYNGDIKVIIGIDGQGIITGVRVLAHNETPGLGDKIDLRVTNWILNFTGKSVTTDNQASWLVKKDGGQFDQFTGATITPRAIVRIVKDTVQYVSSHQSEIFAQPLGCLGE
jgi:Na+-translocating ferredoxin:NAD+ oxidoreductase subunit G